MKYIPDSLTRTVGLNVLKAQKHSPTILFAAGVVGVAATVVLACRATLKVSDVLDDFEKDRDALNSLSHSAYTEDDGVKDKAYLYTKYSLELCKLYAPATIVGIASIGCLGGSHVVLNRRNVALTAAYATVDKAFKEYRANVKEQYGDDADNAFRFGSEEVEEKVVGKDGKTRTVKLTQTKKPGLSMYARCFDESSPRWSRIPNQNQFFINCQQNYANDRLRQRGYIFLNEVYDTLGIPRSTAGQQVGWVYNNPKGGDNYIDFGIFKGDDLAAEEFVMGDERSVWLDFNVDGVVMDLLEG